jgi:hypothetical protein
MDAIPVETKAGKRLPAIRVQAEHSWLDRQPIECYARLGPMATAASIPIEQYLRTTYEPDAELVGGEIEERNVGEYLHNLAQRAVLIWFFLHEKEWQIRSIQEQKTRFPWEMSAFPM